MPPVSDKVSPTELSKLYNQPFRTDSFQVTTNSITAEDTGKLLRRCRFKEYLEFESGHDPEHR
jgi:hypothetical protein